MIKPIPRPKHQLHPIALARNRAAGLGLASSGDFVLLVRGFHADPVKNTPSITLLQI